MTDTWIVAHDFSPCSVAAAFEAARILEGLHGSLRLVHVHQPLTLAPEERWGDATFALEGEIRERLTTLGKSLKQGHPHVSIDVEVLGGDVVEQILGDADRQGATHVVVGTHGKKGLTRLALGSVAEQIVRKAKVPVTVVHEPAAT